MNNLPRKVKFSTIFNILKKSPKSLFFGFFFSVFPLFITIILFTIFSSLGDDTPKVDYELVNEKGTETSAKIIDIETQYNITINDVHPTIITYTYIENGVEIESKYKVLEERKIANLGIGNSIPIKTFNGSSIIKGLKQYGFSIWFFLMIPIPFFMIGVPFLIYAILKLKKELKLYKFGNVSEGKLISMIPKSGFPISRIGQGIIVHYEYETQNGKKLIGESFTTDFSIINDKKKGDVTPIFVSPEDDKKSCIIPKLQSLRNHWNIDFE